MLPMTPQLGYDREGVWRVDMECIEFRARSEGESVDICSGHWEGYNCDSP